ncbi:MAG: protein kinase [Planctomycetales bacterium]|nr:protein kinase [Planctomycetales bacterium]
MPTESHVPAGDGRDMANGADILDDPRLLPIVKEYLQQLEAGKQPDRDEYVRRCPDLAVSLKACLDGLDLVHGALGKDRSSSSKLPPANPLGEFFPDALGDFRIVRELARGGMGVVYEAVQLSLGRRVALKVLPFAATLQPKQLQRFLNEAQAAAHLHHANIVPVFAVGCDRGVHYYAMQLIDGISLAELLRRLRRTAGLPENGEVISHTRTDSSSGSGQGFELNTPDPLLPTNPQTGPADTVHQLSAHLSTLKSREAGEFFQTIARWMRQAAEALAYAHELGIVHRDIKPANLLLDPRGNVWVTDFGLAQFHSGTELTQTGDLVGTLRYMSPEQSLGDRNLMDHRTDVYSLGATFYELVTLRPIFSGVNKEALLHSVAYGEPRPPRAINRMIPVELETIILKAVSKSPPDRYASVQEFADDLQRFLDDKPIHARRPTPVDRARKWSRRHPSVVAAVVLLLSVLAVGLFVHNRRIVREQERTAEALEREKQRATEAEQRFQQARQAVDVLIQVSEEDLADNPMFFATRKRLLETAAVYYQDFIEQREGDVASQQELAAVQDRVKSILHELASLQVHLQVMLLANSAVQTDLKLTDNQPPRLAEFLQQSNQAGSQFFNQLRELTSDARRRRFVELAESHETFLTAFLTAGQRDRLRQIVLQVQGLSAFQEPDVIKALSLTREQRRSIREIEFETHVRFGPERRPSRGPDRGPPRGQDRGPDRWHKGGESQDQRTIERVVELLTPDQADRWQQLTGPKFEGQAGFMPPGGAPSFPPPTLR